MRNINTSRKHPKPEPDQIIITFRLSCQANGNLITEATDCCSSSDGVATNIALPFWGFHSTRRVYGQVVKYSKKKNKKQIKKIYKNFVEGVTMWSAYVMIPSKHPDAFCRFSR